MTVMIIIVMILVVSAMFFLLAPSLPASSSILDESSDVVAIKIHETNFYPLLQPYHDLVRVSVQRLNGNELLLLVELSGDPNLNTTFETVYIWVIDYPTITGNQRYTVLIPHFPQEFGFSPGWHIAIFDNKEEKYVVPMERIGTMPNNKVEVNIDPKLIGNPPFFWWQTYVMIRVDPNFDKSPDFLIDGAPDNSNILLFPFS